MGIGYKLGQKQTENQLSNKTIFEKLYPKIIKQIKILQKYEPKSEKAEIIQEIKENQEKTSHQNAI